MRPFNLKGIIVAIVAYFGFSGSAFALEYCIGADLSYLKQQEDGGVQFRDSGVVKPGLQIFRQHGYNWIRLRLFYTPTNLPNDLAYTLALAQEAKAEGFKFLLDFHYSDTWADAGTQSIPAAWSGLSHAELVDSVYQYSRNVIAACRAAGVLPDMVQTGNEITNGMLWPDGELPHWNNLADLLKAGIRGVDSGRGTDSMPLILLHLDRGGDTNTTRDWFDSATARQIPFDVIGQSYYPYWQGTLTALQDELNFTANRYNKDILVVETAFYDSAVAPLTPYPQDTTGQVQFLRKVDSIVRAVPNGHGKGLFWWEPTGSPGPATRLFFEAPHYDAKPVLRVFDSHTSVILVSRRPGNKNSDSRFEVESPWKYRVDGRRISIRLPDGAPEALPQFGILEMPAGIESP